MAATPTAPREPTQARQNPTAGVVSLVMGILGLIGLPLIGSILALVFGYQSRREVEAQPAVYTDDLGRIGRVLGWVGIGLAAVMLLAVLAAVAWFMPV
jgi:hypothetical protein